MDDEFENVFSGEDIKKMTAELNQEINQYQDKIKKLQQDNKILKDENENLKKQNETLKKTILQDAQQIIKSQLEKSQAIEECQIMKEYLKDQNLTDAINLLKWRYPEEHPQLLIEQSLKIEELTKKVVNNQQIQQYQHQIQEQKTQIEQYKEQLKQQNDAFKEKEYLTEVVLNYITNIDQKHDKKTYIIDYIEYVNNLLNQLIQSNHIKIKIIVQKVDH